MVVGAPLFATKKIDVLKVFNHCWRTAKLPGTVLMCMGDTIFGTVALGNKVGNGSVFNLRTVVGDQD